MMKQSVLVVEDEDDIRELVSYNLLKEGYQVAGAASGEDALATVESKTPDLILLDIMLPGLDGLKVCRKLKENPRFASIPVVMLSAKGEEPDIVAGLNMGADDYITKPFSPKVLLARVRAVLRRAETERGASAEEPEDGVVEIRNLRIHPGRHEVFADGKSVEIVLSCPDDLSAEINAALLEQAVVNLLDNAVKYSEAGGVVELRAAREGAELTIEVKDHGCGIEARHLPRIFERFYRVDKARSRELGGTGLGLAIVRHIALAHRGSVGVESAVGKGSVFRLRRSASTGRTSPRGPRQAEPDNPRAAPPCRPTPCIPR